ncbi:MAG: hypothetical protein AAF602_19945, partial [Myxococcota bacterium]
MSLSRALFRPRNPVRVLPLLLALACTGETTSTSTPSSSEPTSQGTAPNTVEARLAALPSWTEFSPPLDDVAPQPIEGASAITFEEEGTHEQILDEDTDGDGYAETDVIGDVVYRCTEVPYTMTDTPNDIVMFNPDSELLWPGALLQGKSHRDGLGSLDALPIAERADLEVSIPVLRGGDNVRVVAGPTQAPVAGAIGDI